MRAKILDEFTVAVHPVDWRFRDITGNIYGRLTVVSYTGQSRPNAAHKWNCICLCGNKVAVASGPLKNGSTQSCGCLHKEATVKSNTTHGDSRATSGEYRIYCCAKARCENPTDHAFAGYGGRGIEFRFDSYEHFIGAMGRRPSLKHTLDRIDVNGHYEPGNVRWATWHQQQRNRRNNVLIELDGVVKCQSEWAEIYGITQKRLHARRARGWCDRCAITLPPGASRRDGCPHRATYGKRP